MMSDLNFQLTENLRHNEEITFYRDPRKNLVIKRRHLINEKEDIEKTVHLSFFKLITEENIIPRTLHKIAYELRGQK